MQVKTRGKNSEKEEKNGNAETCYCAEFGKLGKFEVDNLGPK